MCCILGERPQSFVQEQLHMEQEEKKKYLQERNEYLTLVCLGFFMNLLRGLLTALAKLVLIQFFERCLYLKLVHEVFAAM